MRSTLILLCSFLALLTVAQTPSVLLELDSNDKGFLLPRTQSSSVTNPVKGLTIYDTLSNCISVYDGDTWLQLMPKETSQFFYLDRDNDTYGDSLYVVYSPNAPAGYVSNKLDCDDSDANEKPGGNEICDNADNDCDGVVDEGFDFNSDINNCGSCANVCNLPNATSQCIGGVCMVNFCDPGFSDCDLDPSNGCEVNLNSNSNNCGQCGSSCPQGQSCVNGICEAN